MSLPDEAARLHAGCHPPSPLPPDATFDPPASDDEIRALPLCLRRPGPQPHNAGITPGWRHLAREEKPPTRAHFRRLERDMERAVETLAARDTQRAADVGALKSSQEEVPAALEVIVRRISELEAEVSRRHSKGRERQ